MRPRLLRFLVLMVGLLAVGAAGCGGEEFGPYAGFERTPTPAVADLSLPAVDRSGTETPFNFVADDGELLLVYFGSTIIRTLDDPALRAAADGFGADYGVLPDDDGENQVFHTGSLYAVNSAGDLLLT